MTTTVWEAAARFVHRRTGLAFPDSRRRTLEDGVGRVMQRVRIHNVDELLRRLDADADLLDELVAEITVGETYFFRHPEQFAVIRDRIFRALMQEVQDRPVRVWSAGCATGEEPYTLAIIAHQIGIGERVRILATDLSRRALRAARRGRYRAWSLRGTPAEVRGSYFQERDGELEIVPAIRELVEFRYLNLAEDVYPALSTGVSRMDLVLCRNVLIYFDAETGAAVVRRLLESLSDSGWLVPGASDPLLAEWAGLTVVATDAGLVYRRGSAAEPAPAWHRFSPAPRGRSEPVEPLLPPPAESPAVGGPAGPATEAALPGAANRAAEGAVAGGASAAEEARARYAARDYDRAASLAARAVQGADEDPEPWVLLVRSLANLGRMDEAARTCLAATERHPTVPELAYLEAVLFADIQRHAEAVGAARRALYLDPHFVMGHLALGGALWRLGDREGARRAYRNAQAILAELPPEGVVPAADGEPAGRLLLLARAQQQLLEDAA